MSSLRKRTDAERVANESQRQRRAKTIERAGGTFRAIVEELCAIAFSRIDDYVTISEEGRISGKTFEEIKAQAGGGRKLAAVKKVKEHTRTTESADGKEIFRDSRVEYELYDKMDALWRLVELKGEKPVERKDVTHGGTISIRIKGKDDGAV